MILENWRFAIASLGATVEITTEDELVGLVGHGGTTVIVDRVVTVVVVMLFALG